MPKRADGTVDDEHFRKHILEHYDQAHLDEYDRAKKERPDLESVAWLAQAVRRLMAQRDAVNH